MHGFFCCFSDNKKKERINRIPDEAYDKVSIKEVVVGHGLNADEIIVSDKTVHDPQKYSLKNERINDHCIQSSNRSEENHFKNNEINSISTRLSKSNNYKFLFIKKQIIETLIILKPK